MSTARTTPPAQTTALVKVDMPHWLSSVAAPYLNNPNFEVLLPSIPVNAELAYGHQVEARIVQIDPDPAAKEVFKVGSKDSVDLFAYSKQGLEKMAEAAGIQIITSRVDDRSNPDYCEIKARAAMRDSSGQAIIREATKAFFMPDVESNAIQEKRRYGDQKNKSDDELRPLVASEMASFRKHLLARTETGAILRVIRNLLAIKSGLPRAQIAKAKVLFRVVFNPKPESDLERRAILDHGSNAMLALYGPPQAPAPSKTHVGMAHVVEQPDDEETERARLAVSGTEPTPKPEPTQEQLLQYVQEGCGILGLNILETNDLFTKHGGDLKAMKAEIEARVAARDAGGES